MSDDHSTLIKALYRYSFRTGTIRYRRGIHGGKKAHLHRCPTNAYLLRVGHDYYKAQDVVWLLVHGSWPTSRLKQLNGRWWDHSIANLA